MKSVSDVMKEVNISTEEFLKDPAGSAARYIRAGMEEGIHASAEQAKIRGIVPSYPAHCPPKQRALGRSFPVVDKQAILSLILQIK